MTWISVKDKLPIDEEQILQYCPTDFPIINGIRLESGAPKGFSIDFLRPNSTHWMPLPKPPEENKDGMD